MTTSPPDDTNVVHAPWPFTTCPTCDNPDFLTRSAEGQVIFICLACRSAWRYALGYLTAVDLTESPTSPPVRP